MANYEPEQWAEFFLAVGSGAAALTGLVVVAMSMHLDIITNDPVLRHRARMILTGLAATFLRCSLALMGGQDARAVAVDLFLVCFVVTTIARFSYAPVRQLHTRHRGSFVRTMISITCYSTEMVGAALLFFGHAHGLHLAAVAMIANLALMISGSWMLLLGIRQDEDAED